MARLPRLSSLTPDEKDDLIVELARLLEAQAAEIAELRAQLSDGKPPKTPDNSSLPPSRAHKRNRPPKAKRPRKK